MSRQPGAYIKDGANTIANTTWHADAACASASPLLFFAPEGEDGESRGIRIAAAKTVCGSCPVVEQCLDSAIRGGVMHGIWGGLTTDERIAFAARRDGGRVPLTVLIRQAEKLRAEGLSWKEVGVRLGKDPLYLSGAVNKWKRRTRAAEAVAS
jgi:WhiB family transcriptional regulator, redox-sensing transcriptional regulator